MSAQIIRIKEVSKRTGIGRSTIYKYMNENRFPKSIRLGKRAAGWIVDEVDSWIDVRIQQRNGTEN